MQKIKYLLYGWMIMLLPMCSSCSSDRSKAAGQKDSAVATLHEETTNTHEAARRNDTLVFKSVKSVDKYHFLVLEINHKSARVTLADSLMPNIHDGRIALCVAAAFTGELLKEFKSTNVAGDYVIDGQFHKGYNSKTNTGFLATDKGHPFIFPTEFCNEWIGKTQIGGGSLFQQILMVRDGKNVYDGQPINPASANIYSAACVLNDGHFAIIQSVEQLPLEHFILSLIKLDVNNALYLDMGKGWNYGWYRTTQTSPAVELFDLRTPYQTNWLVVESKN